MTIKETIENKSKDNKKGLSMLKNALVKLQCYELASWAKDIEKKHFPETKKIKSIKDKVSRLDLTFRMVGLSIEPKMIFLIYRTLEEFDKRGEMFSVSDATKIQMESENIFD